MTCIVSGGATPYILFGELPHTTGVKLCLRRTSATTHSTTAD